MSERKMFYRQRKEKPGPLNSIMKASELLCQDILGIGVMLLTLN